MRFDLPPPYIVNYWGKAMPNAEALNPWHPAAYHGLDVAAAGEALLAARPQLLGAISRAAALPPHVAHGWLLLGLALHDMGKYTDCFQMKVEERWHHKPAWGDRRPAVDLGHGLHGSTLWRSIQRDHAGRFGEDPEQTPTTISMFSIWFGAICGHHGRPVDASPPDEVTQQLKTRLCDEARADASAYASACFDLFMPVISPDLDPKEHRVKRASWLVAGIAMLADWLGSNQDWFAYTKPDFSLDQYWPEAQRKAQIAICASGLLAPVISQTYTLDDALGVVAPTASPLQGWALDEAAIGGQSLVVIEDLTGAGKTEAGLVIAHRLMQAGAAEGLYWALPTMATADALHRRLAKSYGRLFANPANASLVLAHGSREFNEIFKKSIGLGRETADGNPTITPHTDDDVTATAACTRWLADDRRKTFLADIGVGTIDQAVLAILPSKHQAMRLAGLNRRVLVIDEVHSLDAYQNAITETLLMFQAALGGSAVLISATLTKAARQRLAAAFSKGAGWKHRQKLDTDDFPCASVVDATGVRNAPIAAGLGTRHDLAVVRLPDAAAALDVLRQANANKCGAIWIRNTVQDALDAYRDVTAALPDAQVDLFHARFALGDRLDIERRVLESFGKGSKDDQRHRIVISTQVCEQSIDADWDVMITDLAPIDLIIQRAGRLHRHNRGLRPDPVLYVVSPEPTSDAKPDWYKAAFPRGAFVYPHHERLWLTMQLLRDAPGLPLASQNPRTLVERVYTSDTFPSGLDEPAARAEGAAMGDRAVGRMNALDLATGYVHQAGAWASDTRTPTRLGDPIRTLRLARWDGHRVAPWRAIENGDVRKAWRLSEVSVLAIRVTDLAPLEPAIKRAVEAEIATWPERYDPPLLVPLIDAGDGDWTADVIATDNRKTRDVSLTLRYSDRLGLRFEPSSPHERG
ncbi:MAG: CRISPR-associated helicase Cas3' [Hyphomicrobiaceae bacterium]